MIDARHLSRKLNPALSVCPGTVAGSLPGCVSIGGQVRLWYSPSPSRTLAATALAVLMRPSGDRHHQSIEDFLILQLYTDGVAAVTHLQPVEAVQPERHPGNGRAERGDPAVI